MGAEKLKYEFQEKDEADDVEEPKKYGYGVRHVQMLCLFFIMTSLFIARASMAVAVLAMSDDTKHNESHSNDTSNNVTDIEDTAIMTYDWDKKTQSLILSSFFWGYVLMQIPSGILSKKIGGKTIILISLIANCAICASLPTFAAMGGWKMVCASRVMMGLTQSCLFPASHTLLGQWLPDSERTSYTGMVYGGAQLGTVIAMPVSGFLADTAMGWKLIFYVNSGLLFLTTLLWHHLAANTPKDHRSISQEERDFIEATLNVSEKKIPPTPWKHILRSGPVLVLMAPEFGFVLCFVLFFVDMPTYMEKGLQISLKNSAILSALPYIGMWVGSMFSSFLSEWILNKSLLGLTTSRKIFQSIALYGTAAGLIMLSFLGPEEKWLAVVALIALMTISGFSSAGFLVCQLDLSPNYAGVIMSLLNFVANLGSVLMPIATSYILRNDSSDVSRWRWVFLIMATICAITGTIFVLFGTSERQKWDDPKFLLKELADPEEMDPVLTCKDSMEVKKNESPEK